MATEIPAARDCIGKHKKAILRMAIFGWFVVLLCSMAVYDALLFSSLKKSLWSDTEASAHVAAETLRLNIDAGLRFGKRLSTYRGLSALTRATAQTSEWPMAVLDEDGSILTSFGELPQGCCSNGDVLSQTDEKTVLETKTGRVLLVPVGKTSQARAGSVAVWIDHAPLKAELNSAFMRQVLLQLTATVIGLVILRFLLQLWLHRHADDTHTFTLPKPVRNLSIGVFLLVMFISGASAVWTVSERCTAMQARDGARTGALLMNNINRLLMVGLTFDNMANIDDYLRSVASLHGNRIAFDIRSPQGTKLASSYEQTTELLEDSQPFSLSAAPLSRADAQQAVPSMTLFVSIVRDQWLQRIQEAVIDIVTMLAVSLIFMFELFLLMTRVLEWRAVRQAMAHLTNAVAVGLPALSAAKSALLRPITFFMMFAIDMTVSFIPLRMGELVAAGSASRDVLMALPVSMEMGMTGLTVLIAGRWVSRRGARSPMMFGLALIAVGYLGSMVAATPWQFIAARGVVGAGYGLSLLTAQTVSVKDGLLADMFAGVYAGSLCGSAVGAMLAEHFGFGVVFGLSAVVLAVLIPFAGGLIEKGVDPRSAVQARGRLTFGEIVRLLTDRRFVAFSFLALLPFSVFCVGFLNYFCPIFLDEAGVSQSDIGRIFMINCLIVIYTGPLFTPIVQRCSKTLATGLTGVLCGLSVLVLALFAPLPAALAGSILLGIATGLSIPAHSEYMLESEVARAIGVDQTMSLLDVMQRVGQVLGPILTGLVLVVMTVEQAAWTVGVIFIGLSLVFLILGRRAEDCATGEKAC